MASLYEAVIALAEQIDLVRSGLQSRIKYERIQTASVTAQLDVESISRCVTLPAVTAQK